MVRCSNGLLGLLNAGVLVLAVVALGGGAWLSHRASTDCERFLERPVIALGVLLLALSLAGLAGALCRASCLLWLYLLALFLLIVLLFAFTIFAFVVTNRGAGWVVSGRGYKEYRLGDYSTWLQRRVENDGNWAKIRSCLQDGKVCQKLGDRKETVTQFVNSNLSPIQVDSLFPLLALNFPLWIVEFYQNFDGDFVGQCVLDSGGNTARKVRLPLEIGLDFGGLSRFISGRSHIGAFSSCFVGISSTSVIIVLLDFQSLAEERAEADCIFVLLLESTRFCK